MVEIGNVIIAKPVKEVRAIATNEDSQCFRAMVSAVAIEIVDTGDSDKLDKFLNRMIGKVKDEIEHSGNINPPQVIITLPDNKRGMPMQASLPILPGSENVIDVDIELCLICGKQSCEDCK